LFVEIAQQTRSRLLRWIWRQVGYRARRRPDEFGGPSYRLRLNTHGVCALTFSPADLIPSLGRGLLSFPITFFDSAGKIDEENYRAHVSKQGQAGAAGLFAAGGTGEFFSLTLDEYKLVVRAASDEVPDDLPLLAGVQIRGHWGDRL
jgi:hypothetical protein